MKVRVLPIFGVVAALMMVFCVGNVAIKVNQQQAFFREHHRIADALRSLKDRRPAGANRRGWGEGIGWTVTAHCNIFFAPSPDTYDAMSRFGRALDEKVQGEVDVNAIEWLWDRLAESGPDGKRYTDNFRSSMREALRQD